ncbi:MAG: hypothetical protein OXC57_05480 [Rhodobacteraceae bacterium]|nr:hypothetical protein [Paracoccaceae bacterium]
MCSGQQLTVLFDRTGRSESRPGVFGNGSRLTDVAAEMIRCSRCGSHRHRGLSCGLGVPDRHGGDSPNRGGCIGPECKPSHCENTLDNTSMNSDNYLAKPILFACPVGC